MRTPRNLPFWDRTKSLIKAQKMTQKEFAARVGMNYNTLKYWLCYGYSPDVDTACDIAAMLGVSVEYLAKGAKSKAIRKHEKETSIIKNAAEGIVKLGRQIEKQTGLMMYVIDKVKQIN